MQSLENLNQNQLVYVLSMLVSSTRWHVPYGLVEAQEKIKQAGIDEFWGNDELPKNKRNLKR